MKTTLTILSLLALTLTGCEKPTQEQQEQIDARAASCMSEFNYKGHHYVKYSVSVGHSYALGITHDPDCQCHKKGGSEHGED